MKKTIISTKHAPLAIGPYEQGIKFGPFIFTSGQIPIDPETNNLVAGDIKNETTQVLRNIEAVLLAGGSSLDKVIKVTVYLKNISDFSSMNDVYQSFFKENKPTRSCVEVSNLPKGVGVEMDAVAYVDGDG